MMDNEIQAKTTISYKRLRRFNPAMISKKYDYGSEEVEFGLWVQIGNEDDRQAAIDELKSQVNSEIEKELQDTVLRLRERASARNYTWNAIACAFANMMTTQGMGEEQINVGLGRLQQLLEKYMAAETV